MKLLTTSIVSAFQEQIAEEKLNANIYLCMYSYLESKGLSNLASLFLSQHNEETSHSIQIAMFLSDLGKTFDIPQILTASSEFSGLTDMANKYLNREVITTKSLNSIKELAIDESCPVAEEFCRRMILLQQTEYSEALDFVDKVNTFGDDWVSISLWDTALG